MKKLAMQLFSQLEYTWKILCTKTQYNYENFAGNFDFRIVT
jgi:hypothetical protein